jgi:hypothetical protein
LIQIGTGKHRKSRGNGCAMACVVKLKPVAHVECDRRADQTAAERALSVVHDMQH